MKYSSLHTIASEIGAADYSAALFSIRKALHREPLESWHYHLDTLDRILRSAEPLRPVFMQGNSKLPFVTFSTLPAYTCPGAGECLEWCYSYKSWRFPAAFTRQAQNTILMHSNKKAILAALDAMGNEPLTLRLYVDGDFSDSHAIAFWMQTLHDRPQIKAYGYSKSWREFLTLHDAGIEWPDNYRLNLSNGGNCEDLRDAMMKLPITRGSFHAIKAESKAELRAIWKQKTGKTPFICPGKCGNCTKSGHACGMDQFRNIDIAIQLH